MTVIFASLRPLERSENIKALWDAYDGEKFFINTMKNSVLNNRENSLIVTDEFLPNCKMPMIMIFHGAAGGKTYGFDQPRPYHTKESLDRYLYFITSGKSMVEFTAKQCGVSKEKVLPLGMPRTDLYFQNQKRDLKILPEDKKVYLYVPTFNTYTEKLTDWEKIDRLLNDDEMFIIKNHMIMGDPHIKNDNRLKHVKIVSSNFQSGPFLIGCDVVITDYSSIMFDAHILGKPLVLYEKDYDIHYARSRGMYFDYPDSYSSQHTTDEEELVQMIRNPVNHSKKFKEFFADSCDGHATERIIALIEQIERRKNDDVWNENRNAGKDHET